MSHDMELRGEAPQKGPNVQVRKWSRPGRYNMGDKLDSRPLWEHSHSWMADIQVPNPRALDGLHAVPTMEPLVEGAKGGQLCGRTGVH